MKTFEFEFDSEMKAIITNITKSQIKEISESRIIDYKYEKNKLTCILDDSLSSYIHKTNKKGLLSETIIKMRNASYINFFKKRHVFDYDRLSLEDVICSIGLYTIDYIFEVSKKEMPILNILKDKIKITNDRIWKDDLNNIKTDTEFNLITSYHLLGCFSKIDFSYVEEFEDKGIESLEDIYGDKIKIEELLGKRVIFICKDNIEELVENIKKIKNTSQFQKYFKLEKDIQGNFTIKNKKIVVTEYEVLKMFSSVVEITKEVLYHECGHAIFDCIDIDDNEIKEKQANYYVSKFSEGKLDKMLEIYNNLIGIYYKDPILISHRFVMTEEEYNSKVNRLFGE